MTTQETENWGQLGPAMKALNEKQRAFVRYLVTGKPGYGALTRAYRRPATRAPSDDAMQRSAPFESGRADHRGHSGGIPKGDPGRPSRGRGGVFNMIRDPSHRDHGAPLLAFIERMRPGSQQAFGRRHSPHEDPDREALEELRALRKLAPRARSCSSCTARTASIASKHWKPPRMRSARPRAKIIEDQAPEACRWLMTRRPTRQRS